MGRGMARPLGGPHKLLCELQPFTLIRLACGQPPSPVKGEGLSLRLPILLCSGVSASVRAFPLTGEGGTAKP